VVLVDQRMRGRSSGIEVALGKYAHLFTVMLWIGVGCGIVAFALSPWLKRWMHGVR